MLNRAIIRSKLVAFWAVIRRFFGKIGAFARKLGRFLGVILDDLLVLAGLVVIVVTNYRVNELFGWYSLGVLLVGLGLVFARVPLMRRRK
jgi:uncharacterized membrane protein SirB2